MSVNKAAKDLYNSLKSLIREYKSLYGITPKIRLIGHSHGGNVILNLVPIVKQAHDDAFHVNEVVLLACPCQNATKDYALDPLFEKVYSLSSKFDFVQVIDPQGLYNLKEKLFDKNSPPLFSERYFSGILV